MKYLGIDYGSKRIGIAVSDPEGRIAFPRRVIFNRGSRTFEDVRKTIESEQASKIVIGLPLASDGKDTEQTKKVREFAEGLRSVIALGIEFENELLSTHIVEKAGVKKEHTDQAAAALILQSYLDKQKT